MESAPKIGWAPLPASVGVGVGLTVTGPGFGTAVIDPDDPPQPERPIAEIAAEPFRTFRRDMGGFERA